MMIYLIAAAILFAAVKSQCNEAAIVEYYNFTTGDEYCQSWHGYDNPLSTCNMTTGECTDCRSNADYCAAEGYPYAQECIDEGWYGYCDRMYCNTTLSCPSGSYCDYWYGSTEGECYYNCTFTDNCDYYGQNCSIATGECVYIYKSASESGVDAGGILNFLLNQVDFTCSIDSKGACDATGTYCNTDTGTCSVGCGEDADCLNWAAGTGLNKCVDGACSSDGTCTSSDECASILGFTCNTQTGQCEQPTGCTENADCTTPGVGQCDMSSGTGICVVETCEATEDCVTSGYVCQNPPGLCIESCETSGTCDGIVNAALTCNTDTGLCEAGCSEDSDCTGNVNTCFEGICIITCETAQDCSDVGLPLAVCTEGSCIPTDPDNADPTTILCATNSDCDGGTCQETVAGIKACVDDEVPAGGESCSKDSNCEDGYKCNIILSVCYPACDNDKDCQENFGGVPCESQKFGSGFASITIKYCDVSQTPLPTPQPTPESDHAVKALGKLGIILVVMSLMAFM